MEEQKKESVKLSTLLSILNLGQIDALETVLSQYPKTDLNEKDEHGNFPALVAAKKNNLKMLKLLVNNGASQSLNPNFKDGWGNSVLSWAKRNENEEMKTFILLQLIKNSPVADKILDKLRKDTLDDIENAFCSVSLNAERSSPAPSSPPYVIKGH